MPAFNDVMFEQQYKLFLQTKKDWLRLVESHAICHSRNARDEKIRPIAFTNDEAVFNKAVDLHIRWKKFAELATEMKKNKSIAITTAIYSPVPMLIIEPVSVSIGFFNAATTSTHTREDLLTRYEKQINKLKKFPHTSDAIKALTDEMKDFEKYPEGHKFRHRVSGYQDTLLDVTFKGENEATRTRCGSHGVMIFHPHWEKEDIKISLEPKSEYFNKYSLIDPLKCSIFPNGNVYSIDQIQLAEAKVSQKTVVEQSIISRITHFERRAKSKLARAKTEAEIEKAKRSIEVGRAKMEQLNQEDRELLERKFATDNYNILSITELRAMFGDTRNRRGKNFNILTQKD